MKLHWQIIIGMVGGALLGVLIVLINPIVINPWVQVDISKAFLQWVPPFGKIFINMLKLIAVPLIFITLINGIASLSDTAKLSRIGGKTVLAYLLSTILAVSIGLLYVNVAKPGSRFSEEKRQEFQSQFNDKVAAKKSAAGDVKEASPLQPLIDIVPENLFKAMSDNGKMLQVIFFTVLFGIGLVSIDPAKAEPIKNLFEGLNDVVIKMVQIIMKYAPYGVFALLAGLVVDFANGDIKNTIELFEVLGFYSLVVVAGLGTMAFVIYPIMLKLLAKVSYREFLNGILPAQMLAFSTSSSAATLPVTMRCAEENLKVRKEVSSFVLPMGATVNMDGTSLFQAVSALFIAQAFGMDLTLGTQLGIVATCTLASIGAAAVPGAGTVMLVIVLGQAGIPVEGIALIFAVDRILDMCRTVVNVTGDSAIAVLIDQTEAKNVKIGGHE